MRKADRPKCGALTRDGDPCQRQAGAGTNHPGIGCCSHHLGNTEQSRKQAKLELARQEGAIVAAPIAIHPVDAILQNIARAQGRVEFFEHKVNELQAEHVLTRPTTTRPRSLEKGADHPTERVYEEGAEQLNIWIQCLREAERDVLMYSEKALKAGVQERQMRLAEQQAQELAIKLKAILLDLGVYHLPGTAQIVRRHLTLLSGEPAQTPEEAQGETRGETQGESRSDAA